MNLSEYLARHGLTLNGVSKAVIESFDIGSDDALFGSGSLVEGLGNLSSDIDLYLITYRKDVSVTSFRPRALILRGVIIDITLCDHGYIDQLLTRFETWAIQLRDPKEAEDFSPFERHLLHRLLMGQALWNHEAVERLRARIDRIALSRHKLHCALNDVKRFQVDLAGLRAVGDWRTMLLVAQDLLGRTIDGLLAGYLKTNTSSKWRIRLLQELPLDWQCGMPGRNSGRSAVDHYLELNRLPANLSAKSALAYALRAVAFSRTIFPWVAWKLSHSDIEESPFARHDPMEPSRSDCLPHLDLDVQFGYSDGRFEARRLVAGSKTVELSPTAMAILCLFDGQTPEAAVLSYLDGSPEESAACLQNFYSLISFMEFKAKSIADEDALKKLL